MIAVDPEYQGVGVGKKLLDHGLAYADLERLHVYLEASLEVCTTLTLYWDVCERKIDLLPVLCCRFCRA